MKAAEKGAMSFATSTTPDTACIAVLGTGMNGASMKGMKGMIGLIISSTVMSRSAKLSEIRLPGNADCALDRACCQGSV